MTKGEKEELVMLASAVGHLSERMEERARAGKHVRATDADDIAWIARHISALVGVAR
jgi:hypothetical protein